MSNLVINNSTGLYPGCFVWIDDFIHSELMQIETVSGTNIATTTPLSYDYPKFTSVNGNSLLIYTSRTTLSAAISAGTNMVPVTSTSGFVGGQVVSLYNPTTKFMEKATIDSVGADQLVLSTGVSNDWSTTDYILGTFTSAHSAVGITISRPWLYAWRYHTWSIDDVSGVNFGSSPIRTIAVVSGPGDTLAVMLLDAADAIYKDSSTNIKVLRFEYIYYFTAG